ncbi:hypothetical protein NUW54_g13830 [Trametes sanguinea]|uniref:Uncharacterized protein n=1 Tax=Trametes sanguinea TaxID=158606 RepID=A0ACC1MJ49_9APHY|nr:hypothetical protein NUW54_g13830 [Trametes sanguinea]
MSGPATSHKPLYCNCKTSTLHLRVSTILPESIPARRQNAMTPLFGSLERGRLEDEGASQRSNITLAQTKRLHQARRPHPEGAADRASALHCCAALLENRVLDRRRDPITAYRPSCPPPLSRTRIPYPAVAFPNTLALFTCSLALIITIFERKMFANTKLVALSLILACSSVLAMPQAGAGAGAGGAGAVTGEFSGV